MIKSALLPLPLNQMYDWEEEEGKQLSSEHIFQKWTPFLIILFEEIHRCGVIEPRRSPLFRTRVSSLP